MKIRITVLFIVMFAVLGLPLFAGSQSEQPEAMTASTGEPQYGGSLTLFYWGGEAATADRTTGGWQTNQYTESVVETLADSDFEKYGPRGTGEFTVDVARAVPEKFLGPVLAESWEVTPKQITFQIRKGVMFAADGKPHVMQNREMTAEDVAYSLNRGIDGDGMGNGLYRTAKGGYIESIEATGPYTVVVKTSRFDATWLNLIKWYDDVAVVPHEYVEAGANSFDNLVGTGPFMVDEYVVGSHAKYLRNPNYWGTTTINGKVYDDIPFIDELVMPIIPDESTRIASLRTGGIDLTFVVSTKYSLVQKFCDFS